MSTACVLEGTLKLNRTEHFFKFAFIKEVYDKATCQNKIMFFGNSYLQMYKTLKLFTNLFTLNTNIFTRIKVIRNTYIRTQK
jgi:hypothetical protein